MIRLTTTFGYTSFQLATPYEIQCSRGMRLEKRGKVIAVCSALLLVCGYVAYRNFTQEDAPPESVDGSSLSVPQTGSKAGDGKNGERSSQPGITINGVVLPEDVSEISPATMDAILDGQNFKPSENPPPE